MTELELQKRCEIILENIKQHEEDNMLNIVFMINNKKPEICEAISAWSNLNVTTTYNVQYQNINDDWKFIWQFCRFNIDDLAINTGCDRMKINQLFLQLKNLKLIYPDGTIPTMAEQIIRGVIKQKLNQMLGKKK